MAPKPERFAERVKLYSEQRTGLYVEASRSCPDARHTERQLLLDRLHLEPGLIVCDTMAGGGYVAEGIFEAFGDEVRIICVEPSENFAKSIAPKFSPLVCPLHEIQLADASVDRVSNLAGIHHLDLRNEFAAEAHRILRPSGRFAIADVLVDSPPALWLNGPVDRLSDIGHDGTFLQHGELAALLSEAGFADVDETYHEYTWDFPDLRTMVVYCRNLFRLTRASEEDVRQELERTLQFSETPSGCRMAWSLLYASGIKS